MDRQIRRLAVVLLLCFVAVFVRLNQLQVFDQQELADHPLNTRGAVADFGEARGDIVTADGVVIATSVEVGGQLQRERRYPEGEMYAHLTGYFSFNLGSDGLESAYSDQLDGRDNDVPISSPLDLLAEPDNRADMQLTIFSAVQKAAAESLGERAGSVVALDPRTGEVLAIWSWPTFDPNLISSLDLSEAEAAKVALDADPANPLLARAWRDVDAPGSTFKVVTAAAGLQSGVVTATNPSFAVTSGYAPPPGNNPIGNFGQSSCGGDLGAILRSSCNTAFAEMSAELIGPDAMVEAAEAFGFNDTPPFDVPGAVASAFPTDFGAPLRASTQNPAISIHEGSAFVALSSIGQFDVRSTPLQMALVAAAVANDGEIMTPHVMKEITETDTGRTVTSYEPKPWRSALSVMDATQLRRLMVSVVTEGTAQALQTPGLEIGAKTGTAQTITGSGPDDTHGWIIAFAGPPGANPELAVSVIVEAVSGGGQQTGGVTAAPIAKAVIDAVFGLGAGQ